MRPPSLALRPDAPLSELGRSVAGLARLGPEVHVHGLTHDSREVRHGDLFAALPGASVHGARHAAGALRSGAVAVLTDRVGLALLPAGTPVLLTGQPREVVGELAAALYGDPCSALDVVAVTGTEGKTTTCWLIEAALTGAGVPSGLIGSLLTRLGPRVLVEEPPQHRRTTPEAGDLQATLALLREQGAKAVALEASSHGLALGRLAGTRPAVAVFTGLGHDHLDFHGDRESYFAAKRTLFDVSARAVVTVDEAYGRRLAGELPDVVTVSGSGAAADWSAHDVRLSRSGSRFTAVGPDGPVPVRLQLAGRFDVDNALAALAAVVALGLDPAEAALGMAGLASVPGRVQWVGAAGDPVLGLIDYAHTPGALAAVLRTVRATTTGRILLVTGTGGGRDASKRALLGQAAAEGADLVVLTDDNPREEDPEQIVADLRAGAAGAGGSDPVLVEHDRAAAVERAVGLAAPGDVVVVAGKGPDRVQLVGRGVLPVDDEACLRAALARRVAELARP